MAISAKAKKITKIVVNVILWLFLAFALFTTIMALAAQGDSTGQPSFFGNYLLTVESDSMSPTFKKGDIIVAKKLSEEEKTKLKEDDVITFRTNQIIEGVYVLNTHRIIEIKDDGSFITHGDAAPTGTNEQVFPDHVVAKWTGTKLNGFGNVLIFLQSSTGFLVCIVIPMILFFGYEVFRFVRTLISVKNEGKKMITVEDEELIKQRAVEEYIRQQQAAAAEPKAEAEPEPESDTEPETSQSTEKPEDAKTE